MSGDISITSSSYDGQSYFDATLPVFNDIASEDFVRQLNPVVYAGVMMRSGEDMHGVVFKGIEMGDSIDNSLSIPRKLSNLLSIGEGDNVACYFIDEHASVRKMLVGSVYDGVVTDDDKLLVYCNIDFLRQVKGLDENDVSAMELVLKDKRHGKSDVLYADMTVADCLSIHNENAGNVTLISTPVHEAYPQLFDWLDVIGLNMLVVLSLMIIVAAVNMISALLILLFENISTIGLLKSMGMRSREISKVFLLSSSREILKGLLAGNAVALILCLVQQKWKLVSLNPENYFVSYVPVKIDLLQLALVDFVTFAVILLVLLIPCRFISKVDPATTVKSR